MTTSNQVLWLVKDDKNILQNVSFWSKFIWEIYNKNLFSQLITKFTKKRSSLFYKHSFFLGDWIMFKTVKLNEWKIIKINVLFLCAINIEFQFSPEINPIILRWTLIYSLHERKNIWKRSFQTPFIICLDSSHHVQEKKHILHLVLWKMYTWEPFDMRTSIRG